MHYKSENGFFCEEQKKSEIRLKSELSHPWVKELHDKTTYKYRGTSL